MTMASPSAHTAAGDSLDRFQRNRKIALFFLLLGIGFILLFCGSRPVEGEFHEFIESFGLSLIGAAILGRLWSTLYIGGRKSAEIVTQGPYSLTRNPLYVFSAIGAAGVGAQTGSVVVSAFFAVATVLAFLIVARREEAYLDAHFGEEFRVYCRRVPRFFPRLTGFDGGKSVTVDPARLWSTLADSMVFFAAIPAFEGIEWLQTAGVLPVFVRLP